MQQRLVGSVVISNALREPEKARALAALLRRAVTREVDQKELVGLMDELDRAAERAAPRTEPGARSEPGQSGTFTPRAEEDRV